MTPSSITFIRPLSLGQLLDQAIRLYRRNFLKFITIVAIVEIPSVIIQTILSAVNTNNLLNRLSPSSSTTLSTGAIMQSLWLSLLSFITVVIDIILVQVVGAAALTRSISDSYMGENTGALQAYSKVGSTWNGVFGTLFAMLAFSVVMFIWLLVPCAGWLTGPGIFFFLSMVVFPLVIPVVILEKKAGIHAIRRAWSLGRRRFWWTLGFGVVLALFAQIVVTGPAILVRIGLTAALGKSVNFATQTIINTVAQSLAMLVLGLLYHPLRLSAITLMYFDLRVRTEGFDLALQAGETAGAPIDTADLLSQAPEAKDEQLVTAKEIGYFALFSLIAAAIYVILTILLLGLGTIFMSGFQAGGGF